MSDQKKPKLGKKKLARLDKAAMAALLLRPWYTRPARSARRCVVVSVTAHASS